MEGYAWLATLRASFQFEKQNQPVPVYLRDLARRLAAWLEPARAVNIPKIWESGSTQTPAKMTNRTHGLRLPFKNRATTVTEK